MNIKSHIKQIENLLNREKITKYKLLQVSFNIACVKLELPNKEIFICKFFIDKKNNFNAIESEAKNILYLNKKFDFFPNLINFNNNYLIIQYIENDKYKPNSTNLDFLESIVKIHSTTNDLYGFKFNTQIAGIKQINEFEKDWVSFYSKKRLNDVFELANKEISMGNFINNKISFLLKNMKDFIPNKPTARLLHGDMWEGNILFKKNMFVGFIDPGSFFGHNEMELAYLRWFNPSFIDTKFLDIYNNYISLDKNYMSYEPIYQLYYALSNVALWDRSYVKETKRLLIKLRV